MPVNIPEPREPLAELLDRLHRRIRSEAREALRPLNVTPGQMRALRTVARADGPLRMSELAELLGIARRSTTTVVDQLVERRLLRRQADHADGRGVAVTTTPAGRELIAATAAERQRVAEQLLAPLTSEERRQLAAAVHRVLAT